MPFFDTNDPQQDSNAYDLQQSYAQDLDMGEPVTGTEYSYQFQAYETDTDIVTPVNGWAWAFQILGGAGALPQAPLNITTPLGAAEANTVPSGGGYGESEAEDFNGTNGIVSAESTMGYNYGVTYVSGSPSGTWYIQDYFGTGDDPSITLEGTFFFKPGTWQVVLDANYDDEGTRILPTGTLTVGGVTVTDYSESGGYSALSGATHGTTTFVVPARGGFATFTFGDLIDGATVQATFTWLHD